MMVMITVMNVAKTNEWEAADAYDIAVAAAALTASNDDDEGDVEGYGDNSQIQ